MDLAKQLYRYFRHLAKSTNLHGVHSPFVFNLYTKVIKDKSSYPEYKIIEDLRTSLLASTDTIEVEDFGAGSKITKSNTRKIKDIVKYAEKKPVLAQLLFRLAQEFKPETIIDLGTSLGLTTIYLASAHPSSKVYTFEGCANTLSNAKENFSKVPLKAEVIPVLGNIDLTLSKQVNQLNKIDFAFFDANHRYKPTLDYFSTCLAKAHEHSVFIFDDIHWSDEMEKAWNEIKAHPQVTVSLDLFYIGIVFFRKGQVKEEFYLQV